MSNIIPLIRKPDPEPVEKKLISFSLKDLNLLDVVITIGPSAKRPDHMEFSAISLGHNLCYRVPKSTSYDCALQRFLEMLASSIVYGVLAEKVDTLDEGTKTMLSEFYNSECQVK